METDILVDGIRFKRINYSVLGFPVPHFVSDKGNVTVFPPNGVLNWVIYAPSSGVKDGCQFAGDEEAAFAMAARLAKQK